MEGSAPREPLRGAAATERGFSAPSWDPFVAGTLAVLELGKVILMGATQKLGLTHPCVLKLCSFPPLIQRLNSLRLSNPRQHG